MSKKKISQKLLLEHSKAKVSLLGKYLDRYLNIISNDGFTEKIKVFDLFCGEGEYANGEEGSPLIILRKVNDLHFKNVANIDKIPPIDLFFNDIDKQKTQKLSLAIQKKNLYNPEYGKLDFRNYDYKNLVLEIQQYLSTIRNHKAFIFIDPYGYKEVDAKEIKQLLESKNSEVLLFLPTQFMYRFDKNGTPQALINFLDEIVDYKNWEETTSVWKFIDQLKNGFRKYLGIDYFVDTFSIEKDSSTVYCLFFFSSHIRGFEKMLEAKWELDKENGKGWSYEKTIGMFASEVTNVFEEKLTNFIKSGKRYNGDIYEFSLRNGFLPRHTVDIFKHLQNLNKLFVFANNNDNLRKGAFYINYHNYKVNHNRVFFKI